MQRIPEPELMDEPAQAQAYAAADFEEPNTRFVASFTSLFPGVGAEGRAVDLGCGPADIPIRFARALGGWHVDAVDGAAAMLDLARPAVRRAELGHRIRLVHATLQALELEPHTYDAILSNSLLHHLHEPATLWDALRRLAKPGAAVLVMDLSRPPTREDAHRIVDAHAAQEPEILRRDFLASLCAAFTPDEVRAQLGRAGLATLNVEQATDRHLLIHGRC